VKAVFRIGEFSKIAQVSGRLLRYYDQIGLLKPIHIDPSTGYRYYSASQLPQLNQILTLKELGLSLEQISQLLCDHITPGDIRGMFLLRKAQIEQAIEAHQRQLRVIASRIRHLDQLETSDQSTLTPDLEVTLNALPRERLLGMRAEFASLQALRAQAQELHAAVMARGKALAPGPLVVVVHSEMFEPEQLDCELGHVVHSAQVAEFTLASGQRVSERELPAVALAASSMHAGLLEDKYEAYQALGRWIEANAYRVCGPGREVFHRLPLNEGADQLLREEQPEQAADAVIEVQFPVEPLGQVDE